MDVGFCAEQRYITVSSREFAYSLPNLFTYRITFPHLLYLAYLYFPSWFD